MDTTQHPTTTTQAPVAFAGLAAAFAIGLLAFSQPLYLLLLLLLPSLMNLQAQRWWPAAVAAAYFAAGNIEVPGVIDRMLLGQVSPVATWAGALVLTAIQASPFWLYRADRPPLERSLRMLGALAILTGPGVGFLAWTNPLFVAGLLYPKTGALGVVACAVLLATLAGGGIRLRRDQRAASAPAVAACLLCVIALAGEHGAPIPRDYPGWMALDTQIQPASLRDPYKVRDIIPGNQVAEALAAAMDAKAKVLVLPESVLAPMTPADIVAMMPATERAKREGVTLLVGATEPLPGGAWRNTIALLGAQTGVFDESRLPAPIGNWRPVGGVTSHPFSTDLHALTVAGKTVQVATSICFEDTVLWPHPGLLTGQADVMVSVANAWATEGTRGARTQALSAMMLARLAGVPLVRAVNTWPQGQPQQEQHP